MIELFVLGVKVFWKRRLCMAAAWLAPGLFPRPEHPGLYRAVTCQPNDFHLLAHSEITTGGHTRFVGSVAGGGDLALAGWRGRR